MYRIETHMHTSETSACASSTAEEMVRKYKELGYDGVIITDHFMNGNSTVDRNLPWNEQIEAFCKGYENGKLVGDEIGVDVYFGFEYTYRGTDILTYGLDKQWLLEHPEIMDMPLHRYIEFVKENGGMAIEAHPFREASYINTVRLFPNIIDGMEVRNTAPEHYTEIGDNIAKVICEGYNLAMTSGSDSHSVDRIGMGGMEFDEKVNNIYDFIRLVKEGSGKLL